MVSPQTLIDRAKTVLGAKYKWGAKPDPNDPHPTESDCSGFTRWLLGGAGIRLESSSIWQYRAAVKAGLDVPVSEAIDQPGYLLFRFGSDPVTSWPDDRHVTLTVGGGLVAEATGRPHWNIGIYPTAGRTWTHAARIAGVDYEGAQMITLRQFVEHLSDDEIRRIFAALPGPGGLEGSPDFWIDLKKTPDDDRWVRFWTAFQVEAYLATSEIVERLRSAPEGTLPTDLNVQVAAAVAAALGRAQVTTSFGKAE
jgi:hypothetical protein